MGTHTREDALLKCRTEADSASNSGNSSIKFASDRSSSARSPVLSATTLQTTRSPPPLSDEGVDVEKMEKSASQRRLRLWVLRYSKGRPLEITLDEVVEAEPDLDWEGEEEVEYERREEEEEEEEEESQYEEDYSDELDRCRYAPPSDVKVPSRKRSV